MIAMQQLGFKILIVSGRPDGYFLATEKWLSTSGIPYDRLILRKHGDHRKDFEIKKDIYDTQIEPYFNVLFCVDDRKQVVDFWRSIGLTCLQCAPGNF
jgi:hypothetical protein